MRPATKPLRSTLQPGQSQPQASFAVCLSYSERKLNPIGDSHFSVPRAEVLQATAFEFGHGRPLLSDGTWRWPPRLYRQPNLRDFGNCLDGQWRCRHKTNAPQMSRSQPLDTLASSGRVGRAKFRSASR